jgi:hypothetical protein
MLRSSGIPPQTETWPISAGEPPTDATNCVIASASRLAMSSRRRGSEPDRASSISPQPQSRAAS